MDIIGRMIGRYTVQTFPEIRPSLADGLTEEQLARLDALGAAPLLAFSDGARGNWWLVTDSFQRDWLVEDFGIERLRIFTRAEMEARIVGVNGGEPVALMTMPLLDLFTAAVSSHSPVDPEQMVRADASGAAVLPDFPGLMALADGAWVAPLFSWVTLQTEETQELFDDDFWLAPAWLVGAHDIPNCVLVENEEQEACLAAINTALIDSQRFPFAAWGPTSLTRYVGDLLQTLDVTAKARLIVALSRAILNAAKQGERAAVARVTGQAALTPLTAKLVVYMMTAHEVLGKSLLKCTPAEVEQVTAAVGQLYLAAGTDATFDATLLPKRAELPAQDDRPGGGQYL